MAELEKKLTQKDLRAQWLRMTFLQAGWNYERMQNMGFLYTMVPTLKRLYGNDKKEISEAMQRHLEFFNTHPYMAAPVFGVVSAMEEQRANGQEVDDATLQGVKVGMMGPLAGIGDPVFWGVFRPILGAFGASFATNGNIAGPIIFFVVWNVVRMAFLWYTQKLGYVQGTNITQNVAGGQMQKITQGASILGMFIMGVLVPRWTTMNFPLQLAQTKTTASKADFLSYLMTKISGGDAGKLQEFIAATQGNFGNGVKVVGEKVEFYKITTLQDTLNQLIPGLAPLLMLFLTLWLLKKRISPITIIFLYFAGGIILNVLGIMG